MGNTIIDNYEILDEIGNGGFSVVSLARNINSQNEFALKIIDKKLANNEKFRERFRHSTKILFNLQHPNIVKIEEMIDNPTNLILVMEYVDGIKLDDFIYKNYSPDEPLMLLPFFYQLLDAIDYAHSNNIIHRDIKPSNVLIAKNGSLKLIDFDVLKDLNFSSNFTSANFTIGTYTYMSPEQLVSSKSVNQQSDIYSLGVLLFYLLTGKPLYNNEDKQNISDLAIKIKTTPLPKLSAINPNIPEVFDFIIEKATEKQSDKRFLTCHDFKNHLVNKIKPAQFSEAPAPNLDLDKTQMNINPVLDNEKITSHTPTTNIDDDKTQFLSNNFNKKEEPPVEEKTQFFSSESNHDDRTQFFGNTIKDDRFTDKKEERFTEEKTQFFNTNTTNENKSSMNEERTRVFQHHVPAEERTQIFSKERPQKPSEKPKKQSQLALGDKIFFILCVLVFIFGIIFFILHKMK